LKRKNPGIGGGGIRIFPVPGGMAFSSGAYLNIDVQRRDERCTWGKKKIPISGNRSSTIATRGKKGIRTKGARSHEEPNPGAAKERGPRKKKKERKISVKTKRPSRRRKRRERTNSPKKEKRSLHQQGIVFLGMARQPRDHLLPLRTGRKSVARGRESESNGEKSFPD